MSLPVPIDLDLPLVPWTFLGAVVLATFVSEDLTCIGVGLLIAGGRAELLLGLLGCFLGIFVSDLALWLAGRMAGRRVLEWGWVRRRLPTGGLERVGRWLDRNLTGAVVAARFLPGTRLPLYLGAGILGRQGGRFVFWTFVAALLWTPLLVGSVSLFGDSLAVPLRALLGTSWLTTLLALGMLYLLIRVLTLSASAVGRAKIAAKVARLWRWEFWPTWLFYIPVVPWLAWLSLRYRSFTVWTAANPGIPDGGVVGESKHAILTQLPREWVIPSFLVPPGGAAERLGQFRQAVREREWPFPLVLKPDAGQRGAGMRRVHDLVDVEKYLHQQPGAVLVQPYHPGPHEAGIFYYRLPGEERGHIFSITDKQFPVVIGDGRSTLEELVWRHPRYRMQAKTFLTRHAAEADRILGAGEPFRLALAGNHCQGTMFRDGGHLLTPQLERAVDVIARRFAGFFIGRFDVRYADVAAFKAGRDLAVVELNGVTSESTNIYDPGASLLNAYRTLYRQWSLLYRIGHANRQQGHRPTSLPALLRTVLAYYRTARVEPLAD
ncbi:MAG: VTT domain-containing protein [Planctomycetes bacterium]|nr:VTT domain-containing protein [Planctomycetota bacterium]